MKRIVGLFVEGVQVELFNDEQISVNSSVQNISDISKVFTDFSQSFTVPASPHNNEIFQYFYESDLQQTIDQNLRRDAFIEIDLTFFRRGKIQLEKSNLKNGQVESYTVTFYGDVLALKDKFGEDKLKDLDLTPYEVSFTGTEVYDRITDLATDYDVRYPLIASTRLWQYNTGANTEDITMVAHAIKYYELFPAIKISKIFEAIENDYGITFQGTFLNDPKFTQCFLWAKNTLSFDFFTAPEDIDFTSKKNINDANWSSVSSQNAIDFVDLTTNSINLQDFNPNVWEHKIQIEVLSLTPVGTIYINVFQDGNLLQTFTTSIVNVFNVTIQNTSGLNTNITYQITGADVTDVDCVIYYEAWAYYLGLPIRSLCVIQTATTSVTANLTLAKYMPDMKVSDFFAGVLKEFNMTCVGIEENVFEVLPLDEWYSQGAIVDITQYTNTDEISVERMKLYKKISFKYQESESFTNKNYFKKYNQQYGNLDYQFNYDGSDYVIESPFENLLFTRALDNAIPVPDYAILGYALNDNLQPYTPKPCLMYLYGASDPLVHDIKFYDGSTHLNIDTYALFGQDLTYQNTKYSLNFGADNSIIHNETIQQGLYASYYFPYLANLFNLKQRLINVRTILPISLLTNLRLNDRLIIRDKRYIINEMKSNLTNGEVDFSLYLDFRPLQAQDIINPDPTAQCLDVRVQMINGSVSATITTATAGVTITPSTITTSQAIEVCIPANPNTPSLLLAENSDPIITEDYLNFITENSSNQVITLIVTYTFSDGTQSTNQIIINQQ